MDSKLVFLITTLTLQICWSATTLKIVDSQGNGISGVTCSSLEGLSGLSDASGAMVLSVQGTSIIGPSPSIGDASPLSQIPLMQGEKASITIFNLKGQKLLQQNLSLGDRVSFSNREHGVYFVNIKCANFSKQAHFTKLDQEIIFSGVANSNLNGKTVAKTAAINATGANGISIVCDKTGLPSQVYQVKEGSNTTLDFSKLQLVPLFNGATKLDPENITETSTAVITRFSDRARDRHAREARFHIYDHYLRLYWIDRTATIQITDYFAKGGNKIRIDEWTLQPLDNNLKTFNAFFLEDCIQRWIITIAIK